MTGRKYRAVYDFGLFPYALGDVLTWNVQTAIRCEELGRERVDVYICMDERYPASIFQQDLVTADNYGLLFNELFGAFGTHPKSGNLYIFQNRDELLERLREASRDDAVVAKDLADYERALADRSHEPSTVERLAQAWAGNNDGPSPMIAYFLKHIHSHQRINAFAATHGRIPHLRPSMGCGPDVAGLIASRFAGKKIVTIHMRQRRLDAGYSAAHTNWRDSYFLEWYEFLKQAEITHPDVQFVAVGRLQEKPLELLRLPNVVSLRTLGLGLGHELSLMLKSDLFIGTSSGFAALANFSNIPYFVTKMNHEACEAYQIENGSDRLPFATERQILVYEPETRELLTKLLEQGLQGAAPRRGTPGPPADTIIDVRSRDWEQAKWLQRGATTSRFFTDDNHSDRETAFLMWPRVQEARALRREGIKDQAWEILNRVEINFPRMCEKFPEFLRLRAEMALERNERQILANCEANLKQLPAQETPLSSLLMIPRRYWHWTFPLRLRLWKWFKPRWDRKHRIPAKLLIVLIRSFRHSSRA